MSKAKASKKKAGRPRVETTGNPDDVKAQVASIARKHFASYGYEGASLNKIAAEAGVANSLVNYHFGDKKGLFNFCLSSFVATRASNFDRLLKDAETKEDLKIRLDLFVHDMADAHMKDREAFQIVRREREMLCMHAGQKPSEAMEVLFATLFEKSFMKVRGFFMNAQKKKLVRGDLRPELMAKMLFNLCTEAVVANDKFAERLLGKKIDPQEQMDIAVHHIVELFYNGIVNRDGDKK